MTAQIIQFLPRANHKADRAFWIGREIVAEEKLCWPWSHDQIFPDQDTAPAEYCAGEKDPA